MPPELLIPLTLALLLLGAAAARVTIRRTPRVDPTRNVVAGSFYFAPFPFEDQRGVTKDRPVLVLGVLGRRAAVLMVTSTDKSGRKEFTRIDTRSWDAPGKGRSYLRTDRVAWIRVDHFRRHVAGPAPLPVWLKAVAAHPVLTIVTGRHARR